VKKHSKAGKTAGRKSATRGTQEEQPAITIGIDVGDQYSHFCWLDNAGDVVKRGRVASTEGALEKAFGKIGRSRIALETGTHCHWISEVLSQLGHEVIGRMRGSCRASVAAGARTIRGMRSSWHGWRGWMCGCCIR
jgi:hypothetical protein